MAIFGSFANGRSSKDDATVTRGEIARLAACANAMFDAIAARDSFGPLDAGFVAISGVRRDGRVAVILE